MSSRALSSARSTTRHEMKPMYKHGARRKRDPKPKPPKQSHIRMRVRLCVAYDRKQYTAALTRFRSKHEIRNIHYACIHTLNLLLSERRRPSDVMRFDMMPILIQSDSQSIASQESCVSESSKRVRELLGLFLLSFFIFFAHLFPSRRFASNLPDLLTGLPHQYRLIFSRLSPFPSLLFYSLACSVQQVSSIYPYTHTYT